MATKKGGGGDFLEEDSRAGKKKLNQELLHGKV